MSPELELIIKTVSVTVEHLPIGTNLGLLHLLWALMCGQFLLSRGAVIPALSQLGLPAAMVRRSWAAFRYGGWEIGTIILAWRRQIEAEGRWQAVQSGRYRLKAADMTGFFRPEWRRCPGKHYDGQAEKALPAVEMGLVVDVGKVGEQIVPVPDAILRVSAPASADTAPPRSLKQQVIEWISRHQQADELYLLDAEFTVEELQAAGVEHFLIRVAKNCTARRNELPTYKGVGAKPKYGLIVRPLARQRQGRTLEATPCDVTATWLEGERLIRCQLWNQLVTRSQPVTPQAKTFAIAVIHDPKFKQPWVLLSSVTLAPQEWQIVYRTRWAVERPPLVAKCLLGTHRQFVHADEAAQRLPELALFAACLLAYLAATLPRGALWAPTGFWDRNPKPTAGRLRRWLFARPFPTFAPLPLRLSIKAAFTAHLPKGIFAHRRSQQHPLPLSAVT